MFHCLSLAQNSQILSTEIFLKINLQYKEIEKEDEQDVLVVEEEEAVEGG